MTSDMTAKVLDTMATNWTNETLGLPETPDDNCTLMDNTEELDGIFQVMHGIIIPIIAGVGIIFNILNLIVLSNGKLNESSYTYLTGMAASDFSMLLFFMINGIGRGNFPDNSDWRIFEAYVYFPCGFVMSSAAAVLTVVVSLERFVFIYKPMRARAWCNRLIARRVTAVLWILCVAFNVPRFLVFKLNVVEGKLDYSEFGKSSSYKYLSWFQMLFLSCGSGLALIILNILLIRGIREKNNRRVALGARSNTHQKDEVRLTRTLISIVFIFIMGEIPSALSSRAIVVGLSGDPCIVNTKAFKITSLVSTLLNVLALSLNFVVYCVLNRRFWAVFKEQLCPCSRCGWRANNNHPHEMAALNHNNSKVNIMGSKENGMEG